jgi:methylase of polypeptide subunit release factors
LLRLVGASGYSFVPPTPETHRRVNARPENDIARHLRDVFGWSRPFPREAVGDRLFAILETADVLEPAGPLWKSRVRIATLNGGNYLHSAFPTTQPNAVFFGPDSYRFVRAALAALPDRAFARAVDLGCGSGVGGLSVAAARTIGELWLGDINPDALEIARINAANAGQQAICVESDLFAAIGGDFDLVLANPPYLADPAGRVYRDGGGPLGMRIVREGIARLAPGGSLFLYTGVPITDGVDRFRLAVEEIIPRAGFSMAYSEIDPDVFGEELDLPAYHGTDRIAAVATTITRVD